MQGAKSTDLLVLGVLEPWLASRLEERGQHLVFSIVIRHDGLQRGAHHVPLHAEAGAPLVKAGGHGVVVGA